MYCVVFMRLQVDIHYTTLLLADQCVLSETRGLYIRLPSEAQFNPKKRRSITRIMAWLLEFQP